MVELANGSRFGMEMESEMKIDVMFRLSTFELGSLRFKIENENSKFKFENF